MLDNEQETIWFSSFFITKFTFHSKTQKKIEYLSTAAISDISLRPSFCDPINHGITEHKKPINVLLKQYQQIQDTKYTDRRTDGPKMIRFTTYLSHPSAGSSNQRAM